MYSTGIGELYSRRGVVPAKKYRIELTIGRATGTEGPGFQGTGSSVQADPCTHPPLARPQALLLSDEARKDGGLTDEEVARSLEIASATVERIRRRCVEEGIEAGLGP